MQTTLPTLVLEHHEVGLSFQDKEFCGESTPVMWNIDFSGSVFGERTGFRFHKCFLRTRQFAGGIQYEVNHIMFTLFSVCVSNGGEGVNDCECALPFCEEVCCSMCFFLKWSLIIVVVGVQENSWCFLFKKAMKYTEGVITK